MWGSVVADIAGKGAGLAGQGITRAVEAASYVGEVIAPVPRETRSEHEAAAAAAAAAAASPPSSSEVGDEQQVQAQVQQGRKDLPDSCTIAVESNVAPGICPKSPPGEAQRHSPAIVGGRREKALEIETDNSSSSSSSSSSSPGGARYIDEPSRCDSPAGGVSKRVAYKAYLLFVYWVG
ncbi:unnamed protein product [Pylaiella littoralis]